jgi:hypothetical protein
MNEDEHGNQSAIFTPLLEGNFFFIFNLFYSCCLMVRRFIINNLKAFNKILVIVIVLNNLFCFILFLSSMKIIFRSS